VACAIRAALQQFNISAKIVLLGTPGQWNLFVVGLGSVLSLSFLAEEGGSGKLVLLEKGAYDGMAACLM
jgi:hypothetical protein